MTMATTHEVEDYLAQVREALAGLPVEVRDDLLEDLPDHLMEVSGESSGTLIERLGEPIAYAAELLAAAGLAPIDPPTRRPGQKWIDRLHEADQRIGVLLGQHRAWDFVRSLRPAWWVLRGIVLALWLVGVIDAHGVNDFRRDAVALAVALIMVPASVRFGRRQGRAAVERLAAGASAVVVAIGLVAVSSEYFSHTEVISTSYSTPLDSVSDIYVYDQNGNPVPRARLYDQDGNPVQIGYSTCTLSEPAIITYPQCPVSGGPFASKPAPLPSPTAEPSSGSAGSVPPATAGAPASTSSPTPTASPTKSR